MQGASAALALVAQILPARKGESLGISPSGLSFPTVGSHADRVHSLWGDQHHRQVTILDLDSFHTTAEASRCALDLASGQDLDDRGDRGRHVTGSTTMLDRPDDLDHGEDRKIDWTAS